MDKRRYTQIGQSYLEENSANSVSGREPVSAANYGQPRTTGPQPGRHSKGNAVAVRDRVGKGGNETWRNYKEIYYLPDREISLVISSNNRRVHLRKLDLRAESLARFEIGRDSSAESNIVEVVSVFDVSGLHYIVLEEMQISLNHVVQCALYPTNSELVAILVQEYFQEMTQEIGVSNARALHKIALRLMYKDDPHIKDQRRWQSFHNFVDHAASSDSAVKLRKEGVLSSRWTKESLMALFALAEVNSKRLYREISEEPGKS
ncbi:hypothetical protein X797_011995 [Metarhizium robertsii]|uniref:Uncharacterized protein n=1 Tax=Metarhizium robertsii TaxID=568076 RepID=A0A014P132_9HYPO|nr:hypothetical protein X797_011995 [Metarhizium robertsii]